jgi:hypothetical protein
VSVGDGEGDGDGESVGLGLGDGDGLGVGEGVEESDDCPALAAAVILIEAIEPDTLGAASGDGRGEEFARLTVAAGCPLLFDEEASGSDVTIESPPELPLPPPVRTFEMALVPPPPTGLGRVGQRYGLEARLNPVIAAAATTPTAMSREVGTVRRQAIIRFSSDVSGAASGN